MSQSGYFYHGATDIIRPIMALITGIQAPASRVMGHAGAFVGAGEKRAAGKVRALEDVGVVITNHPSKFGEGMKRLLANEIHRIPSVSDIRGRRHGIAAAFWEADPGSHHHHTTRASKGICTLFEDLPYLLQVIQLTISGETFVSQNPKASEC